jgi:hypothetical protein
MFEATTTHVIAATGVKYRRIGVFLLSAISDAP